LKLHDDGRFGFGVRGRVDRHYWFLERRWRKMLERKT